jgi:hypothetical protein
VTEPALPVPRFANLSFVTSNLAIGGDISQKEGLAAKQLADLKRLGVTHVVDCRGEWNDALLFRSSLPDIAYLHHGMDDAGQRVPMAWFEAAITWIEAAGPDAVVLTHCHMGNQPWAVARLRRPALPRMGSRRRDLGDPRSPPDRQCLVRGRRPQVAPRATHEVGTRRPRSTRGLASGQPAGCRTDHSGTARVLAPPVKEMGSPGSARRTIVVTTVGPAGGHGQAARPRHPSPWLDGLRKRRLLRSLATPFAGSAPALERYAPRTSALWACSASPASETSREPFGSARAPSRSGHRTAPQ